MLTHHKMYKFKHKEWYQSKYDWILLKIPKILILGSRIMERIIYSLRKQFNLRQIQKNSKWMSLADSSRNIPNSLLLLICFLRIRRYKQMISAKKFNRLLKIKMIMYLSTFKIRLKYINREAGHLIWIFIEIQSH